MIDYVSRPTTTYLFPQPCYVVECLHVGKIEMLVKTHGQLHLAGVPCH